MAKNYGYTNDILMNDILKFIKSFMIDNNYSPSIREIAEHESVAIATVHGYLRRLVEEGYITMNKMQSRTIVPVGWHYEVDKR